MAPNPGGVYRRIAVTVLVPIAAMLLARIPVPGVDTTVFQQIYRSAGSKAYDPADLGIFCLGLHQFISAAILVELLALVIRRWRALRLGGYPERDRLWTRVLVIALVLITTNSFFFVRWLRGSAASVYMFGDLTLGEPSDPFWIAAQTVSLIAGTFLFFWLTRLIDRYGIGNGFAVMIVAFMVPSTVKTLYWFLRFAGFDDLMTLGLAAGGMFVVTRLAGGRRLKPSAPPTDAERLPMPASGLSPVVDAAGIMALPQQIAAFTPYAIPVVLKAGTTLSQAVEIAVVGAMCLLVTWLFNRPRLLAQTWKRGGAPDPDGMAIDDRAHAAFARSLAMALAICWGMTALEWKVAGSHLGVTVVTLTMMACVVMDVVDEVRFRLRHGTLVPAWPVHRLFVLPVMLDALKAAGIPAFPRARHFRTLQNFFAPYAPVDILVPADQLAPAETILRARSGMDDQGTRQPIRDVATTTSS